MSEATPSANDEPVDEVEPVDEAEPVDALAVLAEVRPVERPAPAPLAAAQAAAAAATGFLAGAATLALVRRRSARKLARLQPGAGVHPARPVGLGPSAGSRTYLVNVRLITKSGE
ncbi:MAG: hypothetical protein ACR2OB_03405 [Solirubrobacteraceae bacterium]